MKNCVKTLHKNDNGFNYLKQKFIKLSDAKFREGISVGPHTRKLIYDDSSFDESLNPTESAAWNSFEVLAHGFLDNKTCENYENKVSPLVHNYTKLGCRMSLKTLEPFIMNEEHIPTKL
jgi:hypothetical protein